MQGLISQVVTFTTTLWLTKEKFTLSQHHCDLDFELWGYGGRAHFRKKKIQISDCIKTEIDLKRTKVKGACTQKY